MKNKQLASQQANSPIKIALLVEAASLLTGKHKLTHEVAYIWLTSPHSAFDGLKPVQLFHSKSASRVVMFLETADKGIIPLF